MGFGSLAGVLQPVERRRSRLLFLRRRRGTTIDLRGWHPRYARRRRRFL
ncbi:MAG TPA: hypothetical protein VFA05_08565 [Gaiellaceae bacterium]|nr:hypothetical protein [Gaiellaceae bacterium]